jgi:hypothetical protein
MKLQAYCDSTGLSYVKLAERLSKRLGRKVSPGTIRAIAYGGGTRSDLALALIEDTQEHPAAGGATITLADLVRDNA